MQGDEVSVRELFKLLGSRKKAIFGTTLACGLIAAGLSLLMPRVYRTSTIIQGGKIYPPSDPTRQIYAEPIEDAALLAEAINAGSFVSDTLKKMGDDDLETLLDIEVEAEAFEYGRGRDILPMVVIYQESPNPARSVEFLRKMAEIIIERSQDKYESNRVALEDSIRNAEDKIKGLSNLIVIKEGMRESISKHLAEEEGNLDDYKGQFAQVRSDQINAVELLFLQSAAMNLGKLIESAGQIESELIASIEENQALIGEYRDMAAIFQLRLALSTPTQVIQEPVLPRVPVRPQRALIVVIASLVGLVFSSSLIFIRRILTD